LSDFNSGFALAKEGDISYYISPVGSRLQLSPKYIYYPYKEGFARVQEKEEWGYVDTHNEFLVKPRFSSACDFSGGYAFVSRKDDKYLINAKGSKKTVANVDTALLFRDGMAKVALGDAFAYISSELILLPARFKEAADFSEELAAVTFLDGTKGYIAKNGMSAFKANYAQLGNFSEGLAQIKGYKGRFGYINKQGELVIDTIFNSVTDFHDGLAYASHQGRLGVIKLRQAEDLNVQSIITGMALTDENKNGKIDAEESFSISVRIKNTGTETLREPILTLSTGVSDLSFFDFDKKVQKLDSIKAGKDTLVVFNGKAKISLVSKEIKFATKLDADNLFLAQSEDVVCSATGINECKPLLAKYWVYKSNHTPLKAGDEVNLKVDVMNEGVDVAKDVKVALIWPEGTKGAATLELSVLDPGATESLVTTFKLDSILTAKEFTIVGCLSEYTQKHSDIKYMGFESGKMNTEVNLITNQPLYQYAPGSAIASQQLGGIPQSQAQKAQEQSELLQGLEQINNPSSNKFALVIGNENYTDYKQTVSSEQNVDFALQDATAFAAYAEDIMGVPESNIILLKNATQSQMRFNINKLSKISKTNPGSLELIVYYAGHGQHDVETEETYLIPVDVSISSPKEGVKLEDMYALLSNSEAKRTIVFLDACYSGVGRGIVLKPKNPPIKGNVLVMTASSSTQRSMPYQEKRHGMFTYFLLKTMKETKGNINIQALFNSVKQSVEKNSIWLNNTEQTPELLKGDGIQADWGNWPIY